MEMGRSFLISVSPSPLPSLSPSAHSSRVQKLLPDNLTLCTGPSRTVVECPEHLTDRLSKADLVASGPWASAHVPGFSELQELANI